MKKIFLLVSVLLILISVCGCTETEEEKAQRIREDGQRADEILQPHRDAIEENNKKKEFLEQFSP